MTRERDPRSRPRHLLLELTRAAAIALATAACASGSRATPPTVQEPGPAVTSGRGSQVTRSYADSLREPAVVRSVNGVLTATLVVDTATLQVPRSATQKDVLNLRSYRLASTTDPAYRQNDPRFTPAFPGPTFRVKRGDLVRIQLINNLPKGGPQGANDVCIQPRPDLLRGANIEIPDVFQGCFHGLNYTNIHYHGMHVTPDSTSTVVGDDVLMVIAPGDTLQYSFRIPENQSPGTHWYHPHKHGSVAIQVANGMAGAFIVEDPRSGLDSIVRNLGMIEHLIAIQQVSETVGLLGGFGVLDAPPPLVNGQFRPTIYMAPGEVQRWRIVNENTTRTTKTFDVGFSDVGGVEEPRLYDIARDGVQFAPVNYDPRRADAFLHMAPGQRLDVFVKAPPTHGTHYFQTTHIPGAGRQTRNATLPVDSTLGGEKADTVILFKVVVDSTLRGRNTRLPGSLPPLPDFLRGRLPVAGDTALVVFTDSLNQQPTQFYLGSRLNPYQRFDDNSVFVPSDTSGTAMPMVLDSVQTWKIVNNSQQQINHPFHIHINPFQVNRVVYPLGKDDPFHELYEQLNAAAERGSPIWLDVLPLPLPATSTSFPRNATPADTIFIGGADTIAVADSLRKSVTVVPFPRSVESGTPNTAYAVITQKYDDFEGCRDGQCGAPTGYFVMHCHILGHEERGMMQVLQVVEPGQPVSPPQGHVRAGHDAHQPAPGGRGRGNGGPGQRRQSPQGQPRP
ncbi:MAG TPA: multicopper oxidase family protein [Longimicrobiaceae bacterium]|nr:multicopper oxidase family protein [Longimicrobiaceae bacterium]